MGGWVANVPISDQWSVSGRVCAVDANWAASRWLAVTQHNQSHNIISHTVQSISFTEYKQSRTTYVCAVQSATPLWFDTISHATQLVTQHNQSHNTISHTTQSTPVHICPFFGQPLGCEVLSFEWKTSGNRCKCVHYTCPNEAKKTRWRKK